MRKQTKVVIGILAILVIVVVLSVALRPRRSGALASAIYPGYLSADYTNLTLWVSNPTPRMIVLNVGGIESHAGANWRPCPLWTDKPAPIPQIDALLSVPPFTATQKQITATMPLEPSSRRLNMVEAEALAGFERYYVQGAWVTPERMSAAAQRLEELIRSGTDEVRPLLEVYSLHAAGAKPVEDEFVGELRDVKRIAGFLQQRGVKKMTLEVGGW